MNDTSSVATSYRVGAPTRARSPSVTCRMLALSTTVTRGSTRTRSATWPYPTSTPVTLAAPRCSRQSVKPPVDRPQSRAAAPATSTAKAERAASSL